MQPSDCLTRIAETLYPGHSRLPIPSHFDRDISECLQDYIPLDVESKAAATRALGHKVLFMLLGFSERMATHSLRTGDQGAFDMGLLSLSITYEGHIDTRETLLVIPLYLDVAARVGLSLDSMLTADGSFSNQLRAFIRRRPEDKRIEAMGYVLDHDNPDGVAYKRTW